MLDSQKISFGRKPTVIIVSGKDKSFAKETIFRILGSFFKVKEIEEKAGSFDFLLNEILIFETDTAEFDSLIPLIKKSSSSILAINQKVPLTEEEKHEVLEIVRHFPPSGFLILNSDCIGSREIKGKVRAETLTFGFKEGSDFQATDIKINGETNFKINHKGNIIPVWLESSAGEDHILAALVAAAVGEVLKLNLVKISEALKNY